MTILFERRTDRPDVAGRCAIHLRAYFDGQRLRFATGKSCLAAEWNKERGEFRRPYADFQNANEELHSLVKLLLKYYADQSAAGLSTTPAALKRGLASLTGRRVTKLSTPSLFTELYTQYLEALRARGNLAQSVGSVATTLLYLIEFEKIVGTKLSVQDYDVAVHDQFLGYLRDKRQLAQNTICKTVKHLKAFLRYAREDRRVPITIELRAMRMQWVAVEKIYLTKEEITQLENAQLPFPLEPTRDAFLFCCYTGLRHSDLVQLHPANVHRWEGSRVLRLTQTKTRTAVSIYLTPPAEALLDKYAGTGEELLPVIANPIMNRNLKVIAALAGLEQPVEVVTIEAGRVVKRQQPKRELVTVHTARHTFAVLSLMRGLPVTVLQRVLGHARIQTTMLYAKIIEDFQHQEMRRVWGPD